MTMRDDCEDWVRSSGPSCVRHFWRPWLGLLWAAAYRAGQEEMRERAAVRMIEVMKQYRHNAFTHLGLGDIRLSIGAQEDLANDIRALPLDAD